MIQLDGIVDVKTQKRKLDVRKVQAQRKKIQVALFGNEKGKNRYFILSTIIKQQLEI